MKQSKVALLAALLALGCAPLPLQPTGASFQLGEPAGVGAGDETAFTDASGQTFSLQSLGVSRLLVRYDRRVRGKVKPPGGVLVGTLPRGTEIYSFDSPSVTARALKLLQRDPMVHSVEPSVPLRLMAALSGSVAASDVAASQAYMLDAVGEGINASTAWALEAGDPNQEIAVIDSGVTLSHQEFGGQLNDTDGVNFFVSGNAVATDNAAYTDTLGHGTQVAGLIVATNALRLIGVAPQAKVLPLKVGDTATPDLANVVAALHYATQRSAVKVINLSLGTKTDSDTLREAVEAAVLAGKVVVASAGNDGRTTKMYPAAYPGVLAVGASEMKTRAGVTSLLRASFSNYGSWVGIMAPGASLWTTDRTSNTAYVQKSGTSFSAPLVAGAAALVRARAAGGTPPSLPSSEQVRRCLTQNNAGRNIGGIPHLNVGLAVQGATSLPADSPPSVIGNRAQAKLSTAANHSEIIVSWLSDEPVYPTVLVKKQTASSQWSLAQIEAAPDAMATGVGSSRPSVTISNLEPGALYNYIVVGEDEADNVATAPFVGSIRTKALSATRVAVSKSPFSPALKWTTSFPAKREVFFGTDPDLTTSQTIAVSDVYETKHQVILPRLEPGTTYYYRVKVVDQDDYASMVIPAESASAASFKTEGVKFGRTSVVSHSSGHHVSWTTSVPGESELWYGTDKNDVATSGACVNTCTVATNSSDLRMAHAITLDRPSNEVLWVRPVLRDTMASPAIEVRGKTTRAGTPKLKAFEVAYTDTIASETILTFRTDRLASATVMLATGTIPLANIDADASAALFTYAGTGANTHFRIELGSLDPSTRYYAWVRLEPVFPSGVGSAAVVPAGSVLTPALP